MGVRNPCKKNQPSKSDICAWTHFLLFGIQIRKIYWPLNTRVIKGLERLKPIGGLKKKKKSV